MDIFSKRPLIVSDRYSFTSDSSHNSFSIIVKVTIIILHCNQGYNNLTLCRVGRRCPGDEVSVEPMLNHFCHGALTRYEKLWVAHAAGMPWTFSPPPRISDPDMHQGTCVTQMPWCTPGLLTSSFFWRRWRWKTFPAFPTHAQPSISRNWIEAHVVAEPEGVKMLCDCKNCLCVTLPGEAPYKYDTKLGRHWFGQWLVDCSAPGRCLNQYWVIFNWEHISAKLKSKYNFRWWK